MVYYDVSNVDWESLLDQEIETLAGKKMSILIPSESKGDEMDITRYNDINGNGAAVMVVNKLFALLQFRVKTSDVNFDPLFTCKKALQPKM